MEMTLSANLQEHEHQTTFQILHFPSTGNNSNKKALIAGYFMLKEPECKVPVECNLECFSFSFSTVNQ